MKHLTYAAHVGWNDHPQLLNAPEFRRMGELDAFQQLLVVSSRRLRAVRVAARAIGRDPEKLKALAATGQLKRPLAYDEHLIE